MVSDLVPTLATKEERFERLWESVRKSVQRIVDQYARKGVSKSDIVQIVRTRLWVNFENIMEEKFRSYACRATQNACNDASTSPYLRRGLSLDSLHEEGGFDVVDDSPSPHEITTTGMMGDQGLEALQIIKTLPKRNWALVKEYATSDLPVNELARRRGVSSSTYSSNARRNIVKAQRLAGITV